MLDFFDDPPFVEALFDFTVRMEVEFARAQVEAGATLIGVGDAAASLVGPKLYTQFVLPCEQRLIAAIRALGVPVRLHICGNTKRIVEGMGQTGADIIDLDFLTPLGHARRAMRETQVLLGNIDPVRELARRHARIGGSGAGGVLPRRRARLTFAAPAARCRAARRTPTWKPWRDLRAAAVKLELHPRARPDAGRSALCGGRRISLRRRERLRRLQGARAGRRGAGHRGHAGRAQRAGTPRRLAPGLLRVRGGTRGGRSGAVVAAACSPTKRTCPSSRAPGGAR